MPKDKDKLTKKKAKKKGVFSPLSAAKNIRDRKKRQAAIMKDLFKD